MKLYLEAGIFYVKNPNSLLRSKQPTAARINLPNSVDGILSNGGLTASGGHPYQISEADAKLAGRKRIVVVTTIGETVDQTFNEKFPEPARLAVRSMLVRNLQVRRKHNVPIAIGSDSFRQTALVEALSLAKLQAFDNLTLLKWWCETTAATIFRNAGSVISEMDTKPIFWY